MSGKTALSASRITGTGSAFPQARLTNDDIVKRLAQTGLETTNEWIIERTGICERRVSEPGNPSEQNSSLGAQAAMRALEMAGKRPEDIDQIIYGTSTPDQMVASSACLLQHKIGAKNAWAVDINAACSGFAYGLAMADQAISSGHARTSLVIGADVLSTIVNWRDRSSCILFGDGAGAAIVEHTSPDNEHRILSQHLETDGSLWDLLYVPAGGSNIEITAEILEQNLNKMTMRGKEIFKVATRVLADFANRALEHNGMASKDLDWLVPHQANLRIIEGVLKRLNFPKERTVLNLERFGNTSSATVPTALDEAVRDGRIRSGQSVLIDVFGAGLTYGSILMRW